MKNNTKKSDVAKTQVFVTKNRVETIFSGGLTAAKSDRDGKKEFWSWGNDNLFPYALSAMSRQSTTHRRIINDKADYISGKGFSYDLTNNALASFCNSANGSGESLRQILNKVAFDKALFGNAFIEIITDEKRSFISIFHQDASRCRVSRDNKYILLHHNWSSYTPADTERLPLYPNFDLTSEGYLRSMVHYKDYEPMFENYGVPPYVAGLNVSAIAYKTDLWNISRLDNSFQLSGIMVLDAEVDNELEAERIIKTAESKFAGKPGQVMFMVKNGAQTDESKFIPINADNEGDWKSLHEQSTSDIVVAHSWFRSLSGLDYTSGFNSERILHEYEIALNTIILAEQTEILEPIQHAFAMITGKDASSLQVVNRPPTKAKPLYMKVWEARKNDGLEYDSQDPSQQLYLAQITKYAMKSID